ncbi:uncharacterized protein LOC117646292 [Thrips palmi]|uniref:Uncharacterized protein LOC117646292 n=1 Tax=Thrips palmi TaxID=161013 RepID=A0A6P8YSK7_THRPL|nr:uncharacterized protein LOC117646292 [Thrips palmi]
MTSQLLHLVLTATLLIAAPPPSMGEDDGDYSVAKLQGLDIRPLPPGQQHGLSLMNEGRFTIANDVWTLAVALDLGSFRTAVRKISANTDVMKQLSGNFTLLAQPSS